MPRGPKTAPRRGPSGSEARLFPVRKEEPRLSPFRRDGMEAFSLQGPGTWASLQGEAFSLQDRGFFPSGQGKPCPGGGTWEGETEVALTRHQTPKGSADLGWMWVGMGGEMSHVCLGLQPV